MPSPADPPQMPCRQWCPWLALFRAGGLSVGWSQLGISFLAVMLHWCGTGLLDLCLHDDRNRLGPTSLIELEPLPRFHGSGIEKPGQIVPLWLMQPLLSGVNELARPWTSIKRPLVQILWNTTDTTGVSPAGLTWSALTQLVWSVVCWTLSGVAVCRVASVKISRDHPEALFPALQYVSRRWKPALGAPTILAVAMLITGSGLLVAAWCGRIPWIGVPLLLLGSPLLLLAGLVLAVSALAILCGWPMMVAATAVDDCDGFGALSRTCSFLLGRPWQAAWHGLVSAVYGSVLVAVVGGVLTAALLAESRPLPVLLEIGDWQPVMRASHGIAHLLLATFAASLFWSLVTLNYLLLRQAVDQKPFEDILPGAESGTQSGMPVVGIAATDYRPAEHDGTAAIP